MNKKTKLVKLMMGIACLALAKVWAVIPEIPPPLEDDDIVRFLLERREDVKTEGPAAESKDFVIFTDANGTFLGGTLLDKFLFDEESEIIRNAFGEVGEKRPHGIDEIRFNSSLDIIDIVRHHYVGHWNYISDKEQIEQLKLKKFDDGIFLENFGFESKLPEDRYPRIKGAVPWVLVMKDENNDFDFGIQSGFTADRFHRIVLDVTTGQTLEIHVNAGISPATPILSVIGSNFSHPNVDLNKLQAMLSCYRGNGVFEGSAEMVDYYASKVGCVAPPLESDTQYRIPTWRIVGGKVAYASGLTAGAVGGALAGVELASYLFASNLSCEAMNIVAAVSGVIGASIVPASAAYSHRHVIGEKLTRIVHAVKEKVVGFGHFVGEKSAQFGRATKESAANLLGGIQGYFVKSKNIPPNQEKEAEIQIGLAQALLEQDPNPGTPGEMKMQELLDHGIVEAVSPEEVEQMVAQEMQQIQQIIEPVMTQDPQFVGGNYEEQKTLFLQRYQDLETEYEDARRQLFVIPWNKQKGPQRKETQARKAELERIYQEKKAAIEEEERLLDQAYAEYLNSIKTS
jgi:hypothetical protein